MPIKEMQIVMGNMNAKDGNDNTSYGRAVDNEMSDSMNDDGKRLLECCMMDDLVNGGAQFAHQDIHKHT